MPTVQFNAIPGNLKVPFAYYEINSGGTPYQGQSRLLLIGQKIAAGSAAADVPIGPIQSAAEADALFGTGSMLAAMYRVARRNAPFQPIWAVPLADPAGAAAAGTVTITAPGVTGAGVLWVMGRRIVVQVNAGDDATTVATALKNAINAAKLPVTAANVLGVVTVTARHAGLLGNDIELKVATDEPNALTTANAVVVAMAAGAGTPALATALANLGDDEFDWIAGPYADTTSLNATRDALDGVSGRWSPVKQLYGHYFTANFANLSTNVTLGNGRNDAHAAIMASQVSPSPQWEWAAALAAVAAQHLTNAPELSRPLHGLPLLGILPPRDRTLWWDIDDRQALYVDGLSAYRVSQDGQVLIDKVVTTYQATAAGAEDDTFEPINSMAQAMFAARYFRTAVSNKHSRQAFADENPFNVAEITTPRDLRNTCIHAYRSLCALGVAEKPELFAEFVVVERDPNNANRANAYLPVDAVNQLDVFAGNLTMFLQYQSPAGDVAL